ncbi:cell division protein FtsB [Nitrosomonas nitrosa]|jgi:cell division protein FtsB|uniref:Cell division protein FtsB n=1 Tax=Nitrosomonas nitrosa TaxID=52442 RepID=A0A1I4SFW0_9PROT|nr:cell division protein FtsB [Nitrosomonas nitrosa]PTQ93719.1 cell division protein FtsB [Nitrosomonas nitrosa]SFM63347.1 cell division protein FtsB [Nitrosomonas nitrosa]HNP52388.1 cell division protein FtsB [Nitrosomonas nitrosa]
MKKLAFLLVVMIVLAQYPLWYGKGSWLSVLEIDQEVAAQRKINQKLQNRNTVLEAEVNNLKKGLDAIEELARNELGMIRNDEVFFQVLDNNKEESSQQREQ